MKLKGVGNEGKYRDRIRGREKGGRGEELIESVPERTVIRGMKHEPRKEGKGRRVRREGGRAGEVQERRNGCDGEKDGR